MLDYRHALRGALAALSPAGGEVLSATYASGDPRRCDVENLLLYNVGLSAFRHLRSEDVVLVRSYTPVPPPEGDVQLLVHHHRYELTEAAARRSGLVVAHLRRIPLRRPVTVERVWYDARSSGSLVATVGSTGRRLGLELTVHRPPGTHQPALVGMVKVLVDGVVSALHTHDGTQLDVVVERLSQRLDVSPNQLAASLVDNPAGLLGGRRLLWPYRGFVQWNPADEWLVYLRAATQASSTWGLTATLLDLT